MSDYRIERNHWGKMLDGSDLKENVKLNELILPTQKGEKVKLVKTNKEEQKDVILTIDNPLVTQTIEVMNQTEMVQSLIDLYTTKSSYTSYTMPNIDLPSDTTANLVKNEKFLKPIWYIPPNHTEFICGKSKNQPKINKSIVMECIRKSLAGLLMLKSFNECTESSLTMFMDAVGEFYETLMNSINLTLVCEHADKAKHLSIDTLEKAYCTLTNSSLLSLHNYYKNDILLRNKAEIKEFQHIFQEYEKLRESQAKIKEENFLEM